jgi:hypothetical protein
MLYLRNLFYFVTSKEPRAMSHNTRYNLKRLWDARYELQAKRYEIMSVSADDCAFQNSTSWSIWLYGADPHPWLIDFNCPGWLSDICIYWWHIAQSRCCYFERPSAGVGFMEPRRLQDFVILTASSVQPLLRLKTLNPVLCSCLKSDAVS